MERKEVIISEGSGLQSTGELRRCIHAVCYIEAILRDIKSGRYRIKRGSGFYARLGLKGSEFYGIFTNNHVLASTAEAENAYATFGYEGSNEGKKIKLRPDLIFRTQKELDYSFAGVSKEDVQELELNIVPLNMEIEPEVQKGDQIFVFQHPKGRPKEFSQEQVLHIERPFVYYKADTETGSSGSPVFTSVGLKLIAVHHKGSEELSYNKGTLCSEILSHLNSEKYTQPVNVFFDSQDKEIYEDAAPAKKAKLNKTDCTASVPSEEDLDKLSQEIVSFWKHLGRRLKVPRGKLEEIANDNVQYPGVKEKAFQMLLAWIDMADSATLFELSRALKALGKCRLANIICDQPS